MSNWSRTAFIRDPRCEYKGIPCFLDTPLGSYQDPAHLATYRSRYEFWLRQVPYCERVVCAQAAAGDQLVSAGEGTGEFVVALATKYPQLGFHAFDCAAPRVAIAARLAKAVGVSNVSFFIGSVEDMPFPDGFFRGAIERGVFHVLPRAVQTRNLLELDRCCRGPVVMNWMPNAYPYILRRAWQSWMRGNARIWQDAITTYRCIERDCRSLRLMARFIRKVTGHDVRLLSTFRGDRELTDPVSHWFSMLEPLGGLAYDTTD